MGWMLLKRGLFLKAVTKGGKMTDRVRRVSVLFLMVIVALVGFSDASMGAELRPFDIPPQNVQPPPPPPQGYPESNAPRVDASVYTRFKGRLKTLKLEEKRKWAESFKTKMDAAVDEGDLDKTKHYKKLLEILNTSNPRSS